MEEYGTIKFVNEAGGYGFIIPNDGGKDIFFSLSDLTDVSYAYKKGCEVSYKRVSTSRGDKAMKVELA